MSKTLIVVTGATASGKTSLAIDLAEHLGCDVISADSRQIYRDIPIGTAAPTREELARVRHHFIATLPLDSYYSAACYEQDALKVVDSQFARGDYAVVCGGSMMYVDALTDGIDVLPTIFPEVRERVKSLYNEHGLDGLNALLEIVDPEYYTIVDRANTKRVAHAIEISLQSGSPYSTLRRGRRTERPFRIIKVAIDMPRPLLFDRINHRVEQMIASCLEAEARSVYSLRHLNALNTVGYKEMFAYFDGIMDFDTAVARIAKNTRVYAKKQLTWLARPSVRPTVFLPFESPLEALLKMI